VTRPPRLVGRFFYDELKIFFTKHDQYDELFEARNFHARAWCFRVFRAILRVRWALDNCVRRPPLFQKIAIRSFRRGKHRGVARSVAVRGADVEAEKIEPRRPLRAAAIYARAAVTP
jgi:hypothetical protein